MQIQTLRFCRRLFNQAKINVLSNVLLFALIWHMWAVAALAFVGLIAATIIHTFNYDRDYHIPAEEVVATESERTRLLASHV